MKLSQLILLAATCFSDAFMANPRPVRPSTELFLEDWVANLIDEELSRQSNKKEFEKEWMEKNRAAVLHRMESDFVPLIEVDANGIRQRRKDEKMATKSPEKYCADRCVSTGHCDVYEDFFELSPEQVVEFCVDCVLSEEEDPCDVPDGFYDRMMP